MELQSPPFERAFPNYEKIRAWGARSRLIPLNDGSV